VYNLEESVKIALILSAKFYILNPFSLKKKQILVDFHQAFKNFGSKRF